MSRNPEIGTVDISAVISELSQVHVKTKRCTNFANALNRLFESQGGAPKARLFLKGRETRGLAVIGAPGSGKTEMISEFLRSDPGFGEAEDTLNAGFIHLSVPSPATLKSVGLELLTQMAYTEISERRERWSIWDLVKHRLKLLNIRLLWIDEAHDLIETASKKEKGDILKTLKSLMQGEHPVVLVLSGTQSLADLLKSDDQVSRRFSKICLPPISFSTDGEGLKALATKLAEQAGLELNIDDDLLRCVIAAANKQFGLAIEITIGAIEASLRSGRTSLSRNDFIDYWEMQNGMGLENNVFWTNEAFFRP